MEGLTLMMKECKGVSWTLNDRAVCISSADRDCCQAPSLRVLAAAAVSRLAFQDRKPSRGCYDESFLRAQFG